MRIGTNIRYHRELRGWSQEALAASIGSGMGQSNISRIENNEQDLSWEQIESFAKAFGVTAQELIQTQQQILHNHQQQGGYAANYIAIHGMEEALAAKERVIAAKDETIELLRRKIKELGG